MFRNAFAPDPNQIHRCNICDNPHTPGNKQILVIDPTLYLVLILPYVIVTFSV